MLLPLCFTAIVLNFIIENNWASFPTLFWTNNTGPGILIFIRNEIIRNTREKKISPNKEADTSNKRLKNMNFVLKFHAGFFRRSSAVGLRNSTYKKLLSSSLNTFKTGLEAWERITHLLSFEMVESTLKPASQPV
jgi:hypothetical protein